MNPLFLKKNDLDILMFKTVEIGIGELNNDDIKEVIFCKIVQYEIAQNPPYLPISIDVVVVENLDLNSDNNNQRSKLKIGIFKLKYITQISI